MKITLQIRSIIRVSKKYYAGGHAREEAGTARYPPITSQQNWEICYLEKNKKTPKDG